MINDVISVKIGKVLELNGSCSFYDTSVCMISYESINDVCFESASFQVNKTVKWNLIHYCGLPFV